MKIFYQNKKIILPDFFIVGAARSGTTSLYYYLKQHPKIFMPHRKEPAFFVFMNQKDSSRITTIEEYKKLFENSKNDQKIGEASTVYLYKYENAIKNIEKVYRNSSKKLKIIIILRNPIERAYSHYLWAIKTGIENLKFEEAIKDEIITSRIESNFVYDYIGYGLYYKQVKAYLQKFQNVKIILFDELVRNTQEVIDEIFLFLGVDPMKITANIYNASGRPSNFISYLLYSIFWKENILRKILKTIIPKIFKESLSYKVNDIKQLLSYYIFKKENMALELQQKLLNFYKEDLLKLMNLLNKNQREIIKQWINQ